MKPFSGTVSFRVAPLALGLAGLVFSLEVWLATAGRQLGWMRSFGGDVLAVTLVYLLLRGLVEARPRRLAGVAFGIGCALEAAQFLARLLHWHIHQPVLRIVLGATPDGWDVVAYGLGAGLALLGEALLRRINRGRATKRAV